MTGPRGVALTRRLSGLGLGRRRARVDLRPKTPMRRLTRRLAVGLVLLAGLLVGGWVWLRDSSLVAVNRVTIVGADGPEGARIRTALELAARNMTTLDVRLAALRAAVAPYPSVARLQVSASFPHTMRIRVLERRAVAALRAGGTTVEVADDGTVLRDQPVDPALPVIDLRRATSRLRVAGVARDEVNLLAVAPHALLNRVAQVWNDSVHGLVVQLRSGPRLYFGGPSQFTRKWAAVGAVLASPSSAGAQYIDVTVPARPAAGTGSDTPK